MSEDKKEFGAVLEKLDQWLAQEDLEPELRAELLELKEGADRNPRDSQALEEIYDRFYKDLEFGTGGLRGVLGAGTNRMNIYSVRRATQGLADYVNAYYGKGTPGSAGSRPAVAISYDSRIRSDQFAKEAAETMAANGIDVYLYDELMPTPALSFAVRYFHCCAGVMVTASHNPAKYNGYKVYNEEGCQMTLDAAAEVLGLVERHAFFEERPKTERAGQITMISDEAVLAFLDAVQSESTKVPCGDLKVVYTPLNGAGNRCVRAILSRIGVTDVTPVAEQEQPDGNFPTCPYPNPEKKEALVKGLELCQRLEPKPDLLLATDPDCDRVGIAVLHQGEYLLLSGNEVGVLLLDFLCRIRGEAPEGVRPLPKAPLAVKTIVTTKMASAVAEHYGVEMIDVLTGFKFIGEQIGFLERKGQEDRYIFGYEESYGYLSGSYVRDKDAVNGSMLICEMTAFYKTRGLTLADRLEELYQEYGYYGNDLLDFAFEGAAGMETMRNIMTGLREHPRDTVIGRRVTETADYLKSVRLLAGENENVVLRVKKIELPKSDVLEFVLEDGSSFIVRPSGTEPKLKVYLSAKGGSREESAEIIEQLKNEIKGWIKEYE